MRQIWTPGKSVRFVGAGVEKSRLCLAGCQRVVKRGYICYLTVYLVASCRPGCCVLTTAAVSGFYKHAAGFVSQSQQVT